MPRLRAQVLRAGAGSEAVSYRVLMSVAIDARSDQEAVAHAKKLEELLKNPLVKMAIEGEGIRLTGGDGRPVVYNPKREVA